MSVNFVLKPVGNRSTDFFLKFASIGIDEHFLNNFTSPRGLHNTSVHGGTAACSPEDCPGRYLSALEQLWVGMCVPDLQPTLLDQVCPPPPLVPRRLRRRHRWHLCVSAMRARHYCPQSANAARHSGRAAIRKIYLPRRNLCHHLSPISAGATNISWRRLPPRARRHRPGGHIPGRYMDSPAGSQSVECAINNGSQWLVLRSVSPVAVALSARPPSTAEVQSRGGMERVTGRPVVPLLGGSQCYDHVLFLFCECTLLSTPGIVDTPQNATVKSLSIK